MVKKSMFRDLCRDGTPDALSLNRSVTLPRTDLELSARMNGNETYFNNCSGGDDVGLRRGGLGECR